MIKLQIKNIIKRVLILCPFLIVFTSIFCLSSAAFTDCKLQAIAVGESDKQVSEGESVKLEVMTFGETGYITFQWYTGSNSTLHAIDGANESSYVVENIKDSTNYCCVVKDATDSKCVSFTVSCTKSREEPLIYNNSYIRTGVSIGDVVDTSLISLHGWRCTIFQCLPFERFTITGRGGNGGRLWAFLDENNVLLSVSKANANALEMIVEAPEKSRQLVCVTANNCDYTIVKGNAPVSASMLQRNNIQDLPIIDVSRVFAKPTVVFHNPNIQENKETVCTKFGIFKSGNNFCITYGENVDHDDYDLPCTTGTGRIEYRYKYFKYSESEEYGVQYGTVAKLGTAFIDYKDEWDFFEGGCGYGSSVNNLLFFSSAYNDKTKPNGYDFRPCVCDVFVDDTGVHFGQIHELKLICSGQVGRFDITRFSGFVKNYYTSCPPYYDSDGYKWCIPVREGFAYMESDDGITWNLKGIVRTPYTVGTEVSCAAVDNSDYILFVARSNNQYQNEGDYHYIGVLDRNTMDILQQYRIPQVSSRPLLVKSGNEYLLFITDGSFHHATCYKINFHQLCRIEAYKWFEIYHDATEYITCFQDSIRENDFTTMYLVGNNGHISCHASSFIVLKFNSEDPRRIDDIPFTVG